MSYASRASMAYKSTAVQTSNEKLVVMLYDGWLSALEIAKDAIEAGDLARAHTQLVKAQNIVNELNNTLDMQYEVSKQLRQLYEFFLRQLVEANVQKSVQPIVEQYPIVKGLRDTWEQAIKQLGVSTV
ncbi:MULTISPECIES: flagellar export chaperone FliS [Alicyclobacillus]|uniref:Flagellar secretion chaperone FliS n=1 Tax=Alicyclobacillus acidoterrestris (strain ATCC 49025 / DSM 3922 / CIP 106132 / NCIMB 13137 / GD3B) TaxID=1356854 RepID=A0A9E6ZGC5_ALIAG|nr:MULTISPECIES: flagellar export chaperone FliS [Alicyclobacillus]UNO48797.1 flagellar export chaperone FliS [Alicyclobacillus acidoterrestris]